MASPKTVSSSTRPSDLSYRPTAGPNSTDYPHDPENPPMPAALPLCLALLGQAAPAAPNHDQANPVYHDLIAEGVRATPQGRAFPLPAPTFGDDDTPEAVAAALEKVAGGKNQAKELLKASVSAPFILRTRDDRDGSDHVRAADLWFAVHARLDQIDVAKVAGQADGPPTEAGNMRFTAERIPDDAARAAGLTLLPAQDGRWEWFSHVEGRLLDRITLGATDRVVATRGAKSLVVAARTDHGFAADGRYPNRWAALARKGSAEEAGPARSYGGGASYVKLSELAAEPGTLLVEAHLVFFEPHDWFQGAPILRSKLGVVAQDQIRRLRREIEPKPGG